MCLSDRQRGELLQKAVIYKLLSLYMRKDYVYPIRLLYSTYTYQCKLLEESCTRLILALDNVLSYGDGTVKQKRKEVIIRIQRFQSYVEGLVRRSQSLQNWFHLTSLNPIQQLELEIVDSPCRDAPTQRKKCTIC